MKSSLATFILSAIVFTFGIFQVHAQDVGSYTRAETDDSEVAGAANFAMKARQKVLRKTDEDANVSLVKIISASRQVVAGINYNMTLKVNINDKDQVVEVVVWKKLSDEYELASWNIKPPKDRESGGQPLRLPVELMRIIFMLNNRKYFFMFLMKKYPHNSTWSPYSMTRPGGR